jgi:hypothetical protein
MLPHQSRTGRCASPFSTSSGTPPRGEASRLYEIALSRLLFAGRNQDTIAAARRVRAHVRRAGLWPEGGWTYTWEIEALLNLQRPRAAWAQYRRWLRSIRQRTSIATVEQRARSVPPMVQYEFPILYAWGKWAAGARALEAYLAMALRKESVWRPTALDLMYAIYGDPEPEAKPRVTLTHFYGKLGKTLDQWPDWRRWVRALHPRLLDIGGVTRRRLRDDPALLPDMYRRIVEERRCRTPTHMSSGLKDLVEPEPKVRARQERIREERRISAGRFRGRAEKVRAKVREYFPFLPEARRVTASTSVDRS